jgi:hypothetical protein
LGVPALLERLGAKARDDLRVGLLSPTAARQIVRLPQGKRKTSTRAGLLCWIPTQIASCSFWSATPT